MIYDTLENAGLYCGADTSLVEAFNYIRAFDPATADGRYDILGNDIYAMVASYETSPAAWRPFEAHERYLDVQVLLEGVERMDVALNEAMEITQPYSDADDVTLFATPEQYSSLVMKPGFFAVFYPHDVHRPGCDLDGKAAVRKLIVKVRV